MNKDPFKEYIKESEPDKRDKGYVWHTTIGLHAVDGLKTSEYLVQAAVRNIEGEISFEEVNALLESYYEENPVRDADDRTEEVDKVSVRIATLLSEKAFSFTPNEYLSIHRKLFTGIYSHAGHIRDYNITKKEWVLNGATVLYGSATELRATLDYDFSEEKKFSYKNLTMDEIIHHLAVFVSRLWQIHVFGEGNTRTTEYLELFLRNLLLNESNPLHNRTLHISGTFKEPEKVNIDSKKANIGKEKANIEDVFTAKNASHIQVLQEALGSELAFGRSDVQRVLGLKPTRSSALLREMAEHGIIEPVSGHGKGKYRFQHQES